MESTITTNEKYMLDVFTAKGVYVFSQRYSNKGAAENAAISYRAKGKIAQLKPLSEWVKIGAE